MSETGGPKKPGALDSLSKEELVGRCKNLLQLAQKAKKAKDDAQKQNEALQEESEKEKKTLLEQVNVLESKVDDNEDILKSKKRQLDRLTEENESILEQMDTYCSQLKVVSKEKTEVEKGLQTVKGALVKAEKQSGKAMELEANMICLKESEKQMSSKLKSMEQALAVEKKLGIDKNSQLIAISEKLEKAEAALLVKQEKMDSLAIINKVESDSHLNTLSQVNEMNIKFEDSLKENDNVKQELKECQNKLEEKTKSLEQSCGDIKEIHETSKHQLSDIANLQKKLTELDAEMKRTASGNEESKESTKKRLEDKEKKLKQMENTKNELEREKVEFEQKNSGLIEELNQFNQEMKKRGERIEKLEKINSEQLMKMRNLEKKKSESNSHNENVEKIRLELDQSTNLLKLNESERKNLAENVEKYKKKNISLEKKELELKNQLDEYISEKEMLTQTVSELNTEMVKLKETLLEEEKLFAKNMQEVENNSKEKAKQIESLQTEHEELTEKVSHLKEVEMELSETSASLSDAKVIADILETEKSELLEHKSALLLELEVAKKDIESDKSKLSDLKSQVETSADLFNEKDEEITKLKELNKSMEKIAESNEVEAAEKGQRAAEKLLEVKLKEAVNNHLKLSGELEEIKFSLEEKTSQNLKLSGEFEALKFKLEETNDQNEHLINEVKHLKEEKLKSEEEYRDLTKKLNMVSSSMEDANKRIKELEVINIECQSNLSNLDTAESKYESTLSELKEMKLQVDIYEQDFKQLKGTNETLKKETEVSNSSVNSLKSELEASQTDVAKLTKSLEEVKLDSSISRSRSLNNTLPENDDSRSEVMSTSTVSRVEEANRMRDVEDSFEDRYSKLKLIAIRMKKKVNDQEKVIKELRLAKADSGDSNGFKEKMTAMTKNFNNLQSQYDATVDKLESVEAEAKTLRKDLEASLTECIASKQKSEESIQQSLSAKTELTKMEDKAREAEGNVHSLEITIEEERKERKLLEVNAKKHDELASQLKDKVGENFMIEETVQSLKLQVVQLEETLSREQERADHAHKTLSSNRGQLTQTEADLARQKIEMDELNKKYEEKVRASELLQEQVGDVIKMSEKEQGLEKNKVLQLERQVSALEGNLIAKTQNLDSKEKDFNLVSKEFENYKLRAQSVLKQSKDKTSEEDTRKKQEDLFAMEKMNDALNDKLKSFSLEIRTISMERNGLQDEHDRLMERHSLLLQELATKEKSWREKNEQQEVKIKQVEDDKTGNLERVRKTMENLKQIHQQEMEMMRNTNVTEISKLKQQIDSKENEVIRLELVLQKEQEARRQAEENTGRTTVGGFDNRLDICQIEREACEGQEVDSSNQPSPSSSMTSPVPLDQLLAQADIPDTPIEGLRSSSSSRTGGADRQVSHLAALLSESEAQNSRLEKLTEVLKEEIRTYQRSEERHKHIENLEYVKNVILKFLTLTGAQERARLIPVLKTILKLKKEEVDKIEELVRVDDEAKNAGEGWGSYLHLWSAAP